MVGTIVAAVIGGVVAAVGGIWILITAFFISCKEEIKYE